MVQHVGCGFWHETHLVEMVSHGLVEASCGRHCEGIVHVHQVSLVKCHLKFSLSAA